DLVTKAKASATAYEFPAAKKQGRGRPPKKGAKIKLKELFHTRKPDRWTCRVGFIMVGRALLWIYL
ncbi:hypothetical protein WBG83_21670, partial [Paenibacillus sp. y28]